MRSICLLPAFLLFSGAAGADSSFSYDVDVNAAGIYRANIRMQFSPEVSLGRMIQNFKSETLLSELNPAMQAGSLLEKDATHSDSVVVFKLLGLRFEMLSHCEEGISGDGARWERNCILDPSERDARYFMNFKSEQIRCELRADDGPDCHLTIFGSLKKPPFLNAGKLGIKAKAQSLVNWGKFWMYTQNGSVSSKAANELFERSSLKADVDLMLSRGLSEAASAGESFHLKKSGYFVLPGSSGDAHVSAQSSGFQNELDLASGTELTRNSELQLFQNGEALQPILQLVLHARRYVLVQVLSLICDPGTEPLISALESKARSGLDVRVLTHRAYARLDSACLRRLENAGVGVLTGPFHASYFMNDRSELVIGSESVARMFFNSTGENSLDRDMMLRLRGPVATDALRDFLSAWDGARSGHDRDISGLLETYQAQRREEIGRGLRGGSADSTSGLCRFAAQMPAGRERSMQRLLDRWIGSAQKSIFFSGVKTDPRSPWVVQARARAEHGVKVDFLGNGWRGGNGELTMLLDEWVAWLDQKPLRGFGLAAALAWLRDWDRDRILKRNQAAEKALHGPPDLQIWSYSDFVHYKAWSVDHSGIWLGSANPDTDAIRDDHEAGILCLDGALVREFESQAAKDLTRSKRQIFNAL